MGKKSKRDQVPNTIVFRVNLLTISSQESQISSVIPETMSVNNTENTDNHAAGTMNESSQSHFEDNILEIHPVTELSATPSGGDNNKRRREDDDSGNGNEFCFYLYQQAINFYCNVVDSSKKRRDWSHIEMLVLIEVISSYWKSLNEKRTNTEKARCWQVMFNKFSERIQGRTLWSFKKRYFLITVALIYHSNSFIC